MPMSLTNKFSITNVFSGDLASLKSEGVNVTKIKSGIFCQALLNKRDH